jgi:hypothetical protein
MWGTLFQVLPNYKTLQSGTHGTDIPFQVMHFAF